LLQFFDISVSDTKEIFGRLNMCTIAKLVYSEIIMSLLTLKKVKSYI